MTATGTDRQPKDEDPASFVDLSPVGKLAHTFAPGAVATGFQILPHQCLYLIRTQSMQGADLIEADMVAQRHLNDFADRWGIKYEFRHIGVIVTAARQVKPPVLPKQFARDDSKDTTRSQTRIFSAKDQPTTHDQILARNRA